MGSEWSISSNEAWWKCGGIRCICSVKPGSWSPCLVLFRPLSGPMWLVPDWTAHIILINVSCVSRKSTLSTRKLMNGPVHSQINIFKGSTHILDVFLYWTREVCQSRVRPLMRLNDPDPERRPLHPAANSTGKKMRPDCWSTFSRKEFLASVGPTADTVAKLICRILLYSIRPAGGNMAVLIRYQNRTVAQCLWWSCTLSEQTL